MSPETQVAPVSVQNGRPRVLDREALLRPRKVKVREVPIPSMDGSLFVRVMSVKEMDAFQAASVTVRGNDISANMTNVRARLLVRTLCEPDGTRLFQPGEEGLVGDLDSQAVEPAFDAAMEINGLTAKDIDELAGN